MVLGSYLFTDSLEAVFLPLVLAAVGIVMSIIGTFFVKVKDGCSPHKALNIGEFGSAGLMIIASYFIINEMLPETWISEGMQYTAMGVFWATIAGLIAGSAKSSLKCFNKSRLVILGLVWYSISLSISFSTKASTIFSFTLDLTPLTHFSNLFFF